MNLNQNLLGLAYLSRYLVTFDFPNSVLYLRPGKVYSSPPLFYDLSGLELERQGAATIVAQANRNGPGDAAGLREGDSILAIDGRDTRGMSLFAVERGLRLEGRHDLDTRRDGQERRVVLALDKVRRSDPAAEEPIHRWALLVGVDRDRREKSAGDDQRALAAQLIDNGFERDHVFLLRERAKDGNHQPRKANIERQLDQLLKRVKPRDALIVAFSGQGVVAKNTAFLCPSDGNLDDADTLISLDGVCKKLERSPAALRVVLVDACRGDARPDDDGGRADDPRQLSTALARMEPPPGVLLLNSCSEGEAANDDCGLRHGVFMHFVLEGLQGGADADNNRHVSLRELSSYVVHMTQLHVAGKFNASQRPFLHGNGKAGGLDSGLFALTKPGETIANTIGMKLVLIPDGEFKFGGGESLTELEQAFGELPDSFKPEWFAAEHPQHTVRITQRFYMGVNEVTKAQFAKFVDAEDYETDAERSGNGPGSWRRSEEDRELAQQLAYTWRSCGFEQADDHPVVSVSFNDATAFCAWLSKLEGNTYRVPTEAEWEYACRAGTSTRFYNGEDPEGLVTIGNVADGTAVEKLEKPSFLAPVQRKDGYVFTAPVGRFRPNGFGLYDMVGNVDEWCADWYDAEYYANAPRDDPAGPASGSMRVTRGGGWRSAPVGCRSAARGFGSRAFRQPYLGFRVVRVR
ncbi:MAG TPA: SUMF1/EgtB/PvdO family nonheme iron enzyme [Pirellulales bacterium]|nr:SUMF1/EgtB/PvdO family nonheme iron enzyme [Pirellulales bacterium]